MCDSRGGCWTARTWHDDSSISGPPGALEGPFDQSGPCLDLGFAVSVVLSSPLCTLTSDIDTRANAQQRYVLMGISMCANIMFAMDVCACLEVRIHKQTKHKAHS